MSPWTALHHYFAAATGAETSTWRTVYMIGMQCAKAVDAGDFVAFVGKSEAGADWPDPRLYGTRAGRRTDD
jgi:hypothetical protein